MNYVCMYNMYQIDIFLGIRIEEAEMEMRVEEKDRGAYRQHLNEPNW